MGVPAALGRAEFDEPEGLHRLGDDGIARQQAVRDFHPAVSLGADLDRRAEVGVAEFGMIGGLYLLRAAVMNEL